MDLVLSLFVSIHSGVRGLLGQTSSQLQVKYLGNIFVDSTQVRKRPESLQSRMRLMALHASAFRGKGVGAHLGLSDVSLSYTHAVTWNAWRSSLHVGAAILLDQLVVARHHAQLTCCVVRQFERLLLDRKVDRTHADRGQVATPPKATSLRRSAVVWPTGRQKMRRVCLPGGALAGVARTDTERRRARVRVRVFLHRSRSCPKLRRRSISLELSRGVAEARAKLKLGVACVGHMGAPWWRSG